jgi:serine/threonine protein kinase
MSQCLNPDCLHQNPPTTIFCQRCGSKMVLQDRYRAIRVIGAGGFGRTFLAVDEHRLDTPCVIKQFLPQQSGSGTTMLLIAARRIAAIMVRVIASSISVFVFSVRGVDDSLPFCPSFFLCPS